MAKNNNMIQEQKELLISELCTRLPYCVEAQVSHNIKGETKPFVIDKELTFNDVELFVNNVSICDIKPYLRPLSSMTEDEKNYIKNVARFKQSDGIHYDDGVHYIPIYQETLDDQWKTDGKLPPILGDIYRFMLDYGYILLIDFFNSHHLDYRGLIPRGLALEAHNDMYVIKN